MKKQFNLQEWLADKSQKVVTRDGRSVRILCTDCRADQPIVALVASTYEGGKTYESVESYSENGFYWMNNKNADMDLLFVTDEPELTEFERAVFDCIDETVVNYIDDYTPETRADLIQSQAERWSDRLLSIAKKQLEEEWLKDREGCFWDGVAEGRAQKEKEMLVEPSDDSGQLESEDERVLRIIKRQMRQDAVAPTDEERAMVDAWLEKQKEQKPADDFEKWIDGWYKEHKDPAYHQISMTEKEFKNFCRGIRNMFEQKPEWSEEDERIRIKALHFLSSRCCVNDYEEIEDWLKSLKNRGNSPKRNTNSQKED